MKASLVKVLAELRDKGDVEERPCSAADWKSLFDEGYVYELKREDVTLYGITGDGQVLCPGVEVRPPDAPVKTTLLP